MSGQEKSTIENLIEVLRDLDQKDIAILNVSAETLKARKELEKKEQAPA